MYKVPMDEKNYIQISVKVLRLEVDFTGLSNIRGMSRDWVEEKVRVEKSLNRRKSQTFFLQKGA